jgi:hypothetical protein
MLPYIHSFTPYLIRQRGKTAQKVTRALVSARVVVQVQLVVLLCVPPLSRRQNLGHYAALPPLLVDLLGDVARLLLLLGVVVEDGGAVLRACVWALAVRGGGVVHLVEEFEEGAVRDFLRVVDNLEGFGVYRTSLAHIHIRKCSPIARGG